MRKVPTILFTLMLTFGCVLHSSGQDKFVLNLATLSGQNISKSQLHNFTIYNNTSRSEKLIVRGHVRLRQGAASVKYQYQATLKPGANQMAHLARSIVYTYSSSSLEKLFKQHGILPNGEYEYCVDLFEPGGEGLDALGSDCIYDENQDLFLINLMEPEDKAKLSELYPMFSWTVNSPLISELTYKLRVAEIKDGQRPTNAIMRNRPVYEQGGLRFPTQNYPVTAKSLEYFTPYAWTVDAYYKDILMGSAETWQFVILNDSLMEGIPRDMPYLDIVREQGKSSVYAIGKLKLRYQLKEAKKDKLTIRLYQGDKLVKVKPNVFNADLGDNRYDIDFYSRNRLKHLKMYRLLITNKQGRNFEVNFKYVNPDFF